jgi:hypothetical protein
LELKNELRGAEMMPRSQKTALWAMAAFFLLSSARPCVETI